MTVTVEPTFYLIGGPARVGKSTVARSLAARLSIGWASVDALRDLLKLAEVSFEGDATVEGSGADAAAFFPYATAGRPRTDGASVDRATRGCGSGPSGDADSRGESLRSW
ncbi:MAG: hypothetical protein HOC05_22045 [Gemmatimonadetes bacterium]|nr:hypothetical protein [Gemmatimonadota bacterium]